MPCAAGALYLHRREDIGARPLLVGALVFFVTQMLLRIPLLQYLSGHPWYRQHMRGLLFPLFVLALSAGVFEEIGRYVGFRCGLRRYRRWKDGVAFGVGHGGAEAVLLVGSTYINNLVVSPHINRGDPRPGHSAPAWRRGRNPARAAANHTLPPLLCWSGGSG